MTRSIADLTSQLLLTTACRSTHHRIALLALERLTGPHAGRWRALCLHHAKTLFAGAKAPDDQFKDFKNHVLHVGDGDWGGALDAARDWYGRLVAALRAQDWPGAVFAAGVLSHYAADPLQPCHTAQSEAENVIHRAVEQSISRAFAELRQTLERDFGDPDLPVVSDADGVAALIRAGAVRAHAHYQTVIDHYDFATGAKDPPAGLDRRLKDIFAQLIGHAAVLVARAWDAALAEAGQAPPDTALTLDLAFAGLAVPHRKLLAAVADAGERRLVLAMRAEYRATGKVAATLPEDDRAVRALHAAEVLKVPLAQLDAERPGPLGARHGRPAGPAAPSAVQTTAPSPPRPRLSGDDDVEAAAGIGPKTAARLRAVGVVRVGQLMARPAEDIAAALASAHITATDVAGWQAAARLQIAVADLNGTEALLLVHAGISAPELLAQADAAALAAALEAVSATSAGERLLRDAAPPSAADLEAFIAAARAALHRAAA